MLECKNLGIQFGGLKAVDSFNLNIEKGMLYGLIGPNGAGKTTVFNLLTGVYKPTTGTIRLDGKLINGKTPTQINNVGIARTFQNIRLFSNMSVLDNVKVALHEKVKYPLLASMTHMFGFNKKEKEMDELATDILKVFSLDDKSDTLSGNLPYGEQRKLEIARALATSPAAITNALTLYLLIFIPIDSAAISLSRMDFIALPSLEFIRFEIKTMVITVIINTTVKFL